MNLPDPPGTYAAAVSAVLAPVSAVLQDDEEGAHLLLTAALDEVEPILAHSAALVLIENEIALMPSLASSLSLSVRSALTEDEPIPTLASAYLRVASLSTPQKREATSSLVAAARSLGEEVALHSAVMASWWAFLSVHRSLDLDPILSARTLALELYELL